MSASRTRNKTSRKAPSAASSGKRAGVGRPDPVSYIGIVHHDADSAWGITFPDLPGCTSAADRFEDLPGKAADAVALWFEVASEMGTEIAPPSDLDSVRRHEDAEDAVSFLPIPAPQTSKIVRINITLPEPLIRRIDTAVGPRQRSKFLARAAQDALAGGG